MGESCKPNQKSNNLPATTRVVPINESIADACLGPNSPRALDPNLHIRVATPSITAPRYGLT